MKLERLPALPQPVEAARRRLAEAPLDVTAAAALRSALAEAGEGLPAAVRQWLAEVCRILDGGAPWETPAAPERALPVLTRALREAVVTHPREKQQRHHRLASLLGRVLHMIEGDDAARTVARVTEVADPERFPRLGRLVAECARALELEPPPLHLARGEERLLTAFVDRRPFLCVHVAYESELAGGGAALALSDAALRCAIARQLAHIRAGHVPLLQLSPERLEGMLLDEVPFLIRTPLRAASRAIGWTRANVAARKVGEMLPERSRSRKVARTMGELLPDREQETVLPGAVHRWVRSWLQGVELSADRAGLLLSGSPAAACGTIVSLDPVARDRARAIETGGLRAFLAPAGEADRIIAGRLSELLQFALSSECLGLVKG